MTVICALCDEHSKEIWLGCNGGGTVGNIRLPRSVSKWEYAGDWALGISGVGLAQNVLQINAEDFPEDASSPLDIVLYLKAVFADFDFGSKDSDEVAPTYDLSGLIAHRDGRIWDMDFRLAIDEIPAGTLWARGSGMEFALGADFPLIGSDRSAEQRVRNAVEAAIFYDTDCPGEPLVVKLT